MKSLQFNRGFTLIELLVVIAIVGVLGGFLFVSMTGAINSAKDAKIKSDIGTITKAILVYAANNSSYPSGDTYPCTIGGGTTRCTTLESALAPYLTAIPKTPSNGFYTYSYSGTGPSFTLQSTLSTGYTYQYNSATYFSTLNYISTCVSGGGLTCTETTDGSYVINTYTYTGAPGSFTWQTPYGVTSVELLIVAGGGGGGGPVYGVDGGSGGGGGFLTGTLTGISNGFTVAVGPGGLGGANGANNGTNGSNSSFGTYTALGGGGGGAEGRAGLNGGSGGGDGGNSNTPGTATQGNVSGSYGTLTGYGYNGGDGSGTYAGGGGGAGGAGGNPTAGGAGRSSSISGAAVTYAAGGGRNYNPGGAGTGNGGGSPGDGYNHGYDGGSGIVIIKYLHP